MLTPFRRVLMALAAALAFGQAFAQRAPEFRNVNIALEVPAGTIVLPSSATSSLTMPPCAGCPARSFPITADTVYYLKRTPVTAEELRAAVLGHPELILTVKYSVKTGELVSITADVDPPAATGRVAR